MDSEYLGEWVGRTETRHDVASLAPVSRLAATLDAPEKSWMPGDPIMPLWHWLYFLPDASQNELGDDGHPRRGGFLPPIPLQRRMFAGGRFSFLHPICVGDELERVSTIESIDHKKGRSGDLVFVNLRHEIRAGGELSLIEEQDLVFLDPQDYGLHKMDARKPLPTSTWRWTVETDSALLFRYSALTFNAHRIHYDHRYATGSEGYPGLVVQGPLVATLMLEMIRREGSRQPARFEFRNMGPLFEGSPIVILGNERPNAIGLEVYDETGRLAVTGSAIRTERDSESNVCFR